MTLITLGYFAVGITWPLMLMFSSLVTFFVHVVKIVADDLGAESCRFRCVECRSGKYSFMFSSNCWISLPVDVTVQSSSYEIIFAGAEGSLDT